MLFRSKESEWVPSGLRRRQRERIPGFWRPAGPGQHRAPTKLAPAMPFGPPPDPAGPQANAAQGGAGACRLNHLSLCSPQLNGSGQLKMSSHCLSAQMLAPPPPGLPRLALPPATKPTSEGGSSSPTSPCKHSGSGARGRAGIPEGPLPSLALLLGSGAQAHPVGPGEFGGSPDRGLGLRGQVHKGQGSPRGWPRTSPGSAPIGPVAWAPEIGRTHV